MNKSSKPDCCCIIMASGMGRRFGGNKLLADFCGAPLVSRSLEVSRNLFARRVAVTRHADVAELCRSLCCPVILHDLPARSDTIRLGLEAAADADCCLFLPGDQPLLQRATLEKMLHTAAGYPQDILRCSWGDAAGSPVLFPKWTFPELMTLPEGRGGSWLIQKYPERVRPVSASCALELRDVDSPEDLMELAACVK